MVFTAEQKNKYKTAMFGDKNPQPSQPTQPAPQPAQTQSTPPVQNADQGDEVSLEELDVADTGANAGAPVPTPAVDAKPNPNYLPEKQIRAMINQGIKFADLKDQVEPALYEKLALEFAPPQKRDSPGKARKKFLNERDGKAEAEVADQAFLQSSIASHAAMPRGGIKGGSIDTTPAPNPATVRIFGGEDFKAHNLNEKWKPKDLTPEEKQVAQERTTIERIREKNKERQKNNLPPLSPEEVQAIREQSNDDYGVYYRSLKPEDISPPTSYIDGSMPEKDREAWDWILKRAKAGDLSPAELDQVALIQRLDRLKEMFHGVSNMDVGQKRVYNRPEKKLEIAGVGGKSEKVSLDEAGRLMLWALYSNGQPQQLSDGKKWSGDTKPHNWTTKDRLHAGAQRAEHIITADAQADAARKDESIADLINRKIEESAPKDSTERMGVLTDALREKLRRKDFNLSADEQKILSERAQAFGKIPAKELRTKPAQDLDTNDRLQNIYRAVMKLLNGSTLPSTEEEKGIASVLENKPIAGETDEERTMRLASRNEALIDLDQDPIIRDTYIDRVSLPRKLTGNETEEEKRKVRKMPGTGDNFVKSADAEQQLNRIIMKALEEKGYADYKVELTEVITKALLDEAEQNEAELRKAQDMSNMKEFMKSQKTFSDGVLAVMEKMNDSMISLSQRLEAIEKAESKSFSEKIDSDADKTHGTAKKAATKGNNGSMADAHSTQNPIEGAKQEKNKFEKPTEKEKELIPTPGQKMTPSQEKPHAGIPDLNKSAEKPVAFKEGVKAGEMQAIKKMAESSEAVVSGKPQMIPETERNEQVLQKSTLPAISDEQLLNMKNVGRSLARMSGQN